MAPTGLIVIAAFVVALGCAPSSTSDACTPGDLDGLVGGAWSFVLRVDDNQFSPLILKAQNSGQVTLTLENVGTRAHDFHVDCLATPNDDGCPSESCFPAQSSIGPLEPGASATASFSTPSVEGIHTFRSSLAGDALEGQFVVQ